MRKIFLLPACILILAGCNNTDTKAPEKEGKDKVAEQVAPAVTTTDTTAKTTTATTTPDNAATWQGVKEINDAAFTEKVMNNPGVTIVDFNATWCGPCKALKPIFEKAATDFAGKASFASMDVDQNPVVSQLYNIHSIPLLLFFKKGKIVNKIVGLPTQKNFYAAIEKAMQ